jgi:ribosomal protein S27E
MTDDKNFALGGSKEYDLGFDDREERLRARMEKQRREEEKKKLPFDYCVPFYPVKCPKCANKKVTRYKTDFPIRYYRCSCGHRFKTVEQK